MLLILGTGTFGKLLPGIEERLKIIAIHKKTGGQPLEKGEDDLLLMFPPELGVRQDEPEAAGVLEKPVIFRKGFEFGDSPIVPVDTVLVDKIDRLMLWIPVLAVAGQSDPFHGLADGIIVIAEIIDKEIKLMGA